MDWVTTIRKEAQTSAVLRTNELALKYGIIPVAVTQALSRLDQKGLVERVGSKIYYNWLAADASPRELVNVLRENAYISLESALREYGISTQSPHVLTCVTTGRPKELRGRSIAINYHGIAPHLYWGFLRKTTRYGKYLIAEPEKAILDWIYIGIHNGRAPDLDELNFKNVDRLKLLDYSHRYPSSVSQHVLSALVAERANAAAAGAA